MANPNGVVLTHTGLLTGAAARSLGLPEEIGSRVQFVKEMGMGGFMANHVHINGSLIGGCIAVGREGVIEDREINGPMVMALHAAGLPTAFDGTASNADIINAARLHGSAMVLIDAGDNTMRITNKVDSLKKACALAAMPSEELWVDEVTRGVHARLILFCTRSTAPSRT